MQSSSSPATPGDSATPTPPQESCWVAWSCGWRASGGHESQNALVLVDLLANGRVATAKSLLPSLSAADFGLAVLCGRNLMRRLAVIGLAGSLLDASFCQATRLAESLSENSLEFSLPAADADLATVAKQVADLDLKRHISEIASELTAWQVYRDETPRIWRCEAAVRLLWTDDMGWEEDADGKTAQLRRMAEFARREMTRHVTETLGDHAVLGSCVFGDHEFPEDEDTERLLTPWLDAIIERHLLGQTVWKSASSGLPAPADLNPTSPNGAPLLAAPAKRL